MPTDGPPPGNGGTPDASRALRPERVDPVPLSEVAGFLGLEAEAEALPADTVVTGVCLDSRSVLPGDLYLAMPGATRHGADFARDAVDAGAVAIVTDHDGATQLALSETVSAVPVLVVDRPRTVAGPLAARIYGTALHGGRPALVGVTGTNGKTTTTYFANSLFRALGHTTGLIGTIEIVAGGEPIPSRLTTPESTDVHALLALMRERGVTAASMEVSSHAIEFGRVDGVHYDAVGFTNLTQDHLDLHGTMEEYFAAKAALFTPERAERGVVTVDDEWGARLAAAATIPVTTLSTRPDAPQADWTVGSLDASGLGTVFELRHRDGAALRVRCGLPGGFNVANAALAVLLVLASGATAEDVQRALDAADPFAVEVPGRMQAVAAEPTAVVDFAHNPDALARALDAVRPAGAGRLILVFGATGQRDQSKRPLMGAVAVRGADVVVVTDDDPHDEDAAAIRADVLAGALEENASGGWDRMVIEVAPRADAIRRAVALATREDVVLVAGRGHEAWQEVKGVNLALDDRDELRAALAEHGFRPTGGESIESGEE
ncbi:UDP-N-acetylmuramoyl-L-alanyl-D-glutamate--2,6-diaminopimelate ligase [Sinomonas halotolerans]|uniref:UDP-N-acetylmuramyl-tripeptide synthetase n=1 Tax=Sinomonas halotolerans TaxID=1644133 RepID=A0ABU9X376_9MICC